MQKIIVILGPTASGKTALAVRLAKKFRGEIISADSRQIYRGLNIGTAKEARGHRLVNIRNLNQPYSLAQWRRDALQAINNAQRRGRLPFLVGGAGFYLHALLRNTSIPHVPPNPKLRRKLESLTAARLFARLKKLNPARATTIDRRNKRRLIRAIEIAKSTRTSPSPPHEEGVGGGRALVLGMQISKARLRRNINRRVDQMFRRGLVRETKILIKKYGRRKILRETIGYREALDYLDGKNTRSQAREKVKSNTWHFTRHQYNWFKRMPVHWIKNHRQAEKAIKKFL